MESRFSNIGVIPRARLRPEVVLIVCSVIFIAQFVFMQYATADDVSTEQSAMEFQSKRFAAMVAVDIDSLQQFLAEDLSYAHTTGWVETKQGFLSTVASEVIDYQSVIPRDVQVRIYGDIAVITGLSEMKLAVRGEPVNLTIRFLDVSRRVGQSWQLVAWQSVRLTED